MKYFGDVEMILDAVTASQSICLNLDGFVHEPIIFAGETKQYLMLLMLHNQSFQTLLIVGYVMQYFGGAETILDAVTASRSIRSNHIFYL